MKFLSVVPRIAVFCGAFAALVFFGACGSEPTAIPCGQIPADGCPLGRGGTCSDPTCGAIYRCLDGTWTHVETCTNQSPGDAGTDAQDCQTVMLDHSGEITGCKPDLQNPDCPMQAAEQCVTSVCQSECLDFFKCTADGWQTVAFCDTDGQLVVMP